MVKMAKGANVERSGFDSREYRVMAYGRLGMTCICILFLAGCANLTRAKNFCKDQGTKFDSGSPAYFQCKDGKVWRVCDDEGGVCEMGDED